MDTRIRECELKGKSAYENRLKGLTWLTVGEILYGKSPSIQGKYRRAHRAKMIAKDYAFRYSLQWPAAKES